MYTVTRQVQWPDGEHVVEVSAGGRDYTNPDALVKKYAGEWDEYLDPVEAVETAIAICKAWRKDGARKARVGVGATGGMTMPFDPTTFRGARRWARERRDRLPKCDRCGEILPRQPYHMSGDIDFGAFCSGNCAEMAWFDAMRDHEEEERSNA